MLPHDSTRGPLMSKWARELGEMWVLENVSDSGLHYGWGELHGYFKIPERWWTNFLTNVGRFILADLTSNDAGCDLTRQQNAFNGIRRPLAPSAQEIPSSPTSLQPLRLIPRHQSLVLMIFVHYFGPYILGAIRLYLSVYRRSRYSQDPHAHNIQPNNNKHSAI